MIKKIYCAHCNAGISTLHFHLLNQTGEDEEKFESLDNIGASRIEIYIYIVYKTIGIWWAVQGKRTRMQEVMKWIIENKKSCRI